MVNSVMDRKQEKPIPDCFESIDEMTTEFNKFFIKKIEAIRKNMTEELPPEFSSFMGHTKLSEFEPTNYDEISRIIKET